LWSFALYAIDGPFSATTRLEEPLKLFNSRRLRLFGASPHTQADPFLITHGGALFIFYERMLPRCRGELACMKTTDLETFENCGVILRQTTHLSWPFVFKSNRQIYLVPESSAANEVALYAFLDFPHKPQKVRLLLSGSYTDPILVQHKGIWYLFATSSRGLELFVARDFLSDEFKPHPCSPVSCDARYSRSGGPPFLIDNKLIRIAQDCSHSYGQNVSLIQVERFTPNDYVERLLVADFFDRRYFWNRDGAHHLSVTEFKGKTVIAADGRHRDHWLNKLLSVR
jgi:hypothetical protein